MRFKAFAVAAAGIAFGIVLWSQRSAVANFPWHLSWPLFVLGVAGFTVAPLCGAVSFWLMTRALTGTTLLAPCLRLWTRAFLARYVPLGALTMAVRIRGRGHLRATRAQVVSATVYEQGAAVAGAAATAATALGLSGSRLAFAPALLLLALSVAATLPILVRRAGDYRIAPLVLVRATAVVCVGWLAAGASVWTLTHAVAPSAPSLLFTTGAYALAWLAGFLLPLAPSGLGAREATFVGLMAPHFGVGAALVLALVVRCASVIGDLLAAGSVELSAFRLPLPTTAFRGARSRA